MKVKQVNDAIVRSRSSKRTGVVRSETGSIAEGVVALIIITLGVVVGVLLLVNGGIAAYYKLKIGYVALESARYANGRPASTKLDDTKKFAAATLSALGVHHAGFDLKLEDVKLSEVSATACDLKCNQLSLVGNLFGPVDLSDRGVAPKHEFVADSTMSVSSGDTGKLVYVPVIEDADPSIKNLGPLGARGYIVSYKKPVMSDFVQGHGSFVKSGVVEKILPAMKSAPSGMPYGFYATSSDSKNVTYLTMEGPKTATLYSPTQGPTTQEGVPGLFEDQMPKVYTEIRSMATIENK